MATIIFCSLANTAKALIASKLITRQSIILPQKKKKKNSQAVRSEQHTDSMSAVPLAADVIFEL